MSVASERLTGTVRRTAPTTGIWSWITTVDHKRIGILYLAAGFFFFLVGGVEALLIRLQLARPDNDLIGADLYNQLFTMHGTTMIFLAVTPLLSGFFNYFMPIMIGARDVAYPRLNAFSFWVFLAGGIFLNSSWFLGGAPNAGWFNYANISSGQYNMGPGIDFYVLGLQLAGLGTLVSGINFLVTILNMRAPGMSFMRMPLFVWVTFVTSILIIFAFPALTVNLILLMFDRFFGTGFFEPTAGGNVLLWQHLFWIFGHPEVYILILPAFGIISEVVATFSRKPLFGYPSMVLAVMAIAFLSFMVWSHHMFAVGQGPVVNAVFSITTMAIAVPTGVKIFNWLATMWGGRLRFTTAMLFAVGFIAEFTIGGMSGVMHAAAPSDWQQHDTYFVVAHFHYVLIGGALFALLAGIYYWFPKITGRLLDERLGKWNFWLVTIGFNVTFFPFHFLGLLGMPRRIYTYSADLGLGFWNMVSTVGVFILTAGILAFMYNLWYSLRRGEPAGPDPWDGRTLEWSIPSPPPAYNFAQIPLVRGRDAFWLEKQSGSRDVAAAAFPAVRSGHPHAIHMPSPSFMPALVALGLLVAAYGGLYRSLWGTLLGAAVALLGIYGWAFEDDSGYLVEPEGDAR